jgi:hypothetical protein
MQEDTAYSILLAARTDRDGETTAKCGGIVRWHSVLQKGVL